MLPLLLGFAALNLIRLAPEGLPVAPVDLVAGHQVIALRQPLVTRTPGVRLVLFVHRGDAAGKPGPDAVASFERAVPRGSVTARLRDDDGHVLTLVHTGYRFYQGYCGLVLTETRPAPRGGFYRHLEVDARVPLAHVRFVWLDQRGRQVRDVRPEL